MAEAATWTIRSMLDWCAGYLERHGDQAPRLSAERLVGKACGLERIELYLDMDRPLVSGELDILREDVRKRGQGMPLQYITGSAPFRYLELEVAPGVLIPRPETEVLVSEALALLPPAPKPQDEFDRVLMEIVKRNRALAEGPEGDSGGEASESGEGERPEYLVADLCTGSGCIACSIATEHPLTRVFATDISSEAVSLAQRNVAACAVEGRVQVIACDLGEGIPASAMGGLDLVVSNPPYVPTSEIAGIPREVADFEPSLALDGGADGLDVYRRIVAWSLEALKPGRHLACELHETRLDAAADIALRSGFSSTRIVRDLAGRPRIIICGKGSVCRM